MGGNSLAPRAWGIFQGMCLALIAVFCLLSGCAARYVGEKRIDLPTETRVVDTHGIVGFEVIPVAQGLAFEIAREVSIGEINRVLVQTVEFRSTPRMSGWTWFTHDVLLLKYLLPLGFGLHAVSSTYEWMGGGIFILFTVVTGFTLPILVFAGGTVLGVFLYTPITILYSFVGASHRGIWKQYKQEPVPELQNYRREISYLGRIGDTALSWLPVYPGFTSKFRVTELDVLSEETEETVASTQRRTETITAAADIAALRVRVNRESQLESLGIVEGRVVLPAAALRRFTIDDSITLAVTDAAGETLLQRRFTGRELGILDVIPADAPPPELAISCRFIDSAPDDPLSNSVEKIALIEVRNRGAVPAYQMEVLLSVGGDFPGELFWLDPSTGETEFVPMAPPYRETIAARLQPGETIRTVVRAIARGETFPLVVEVSEWTNTAGERFESGKP